MTNTPFPTTHSILSGSALITEVLSAYDIEPPIDCKLLNRGLNDTYLVSTHGDKYVLRVYRSGWRSLSDINYELDALLHLSCEGIPVSAPIARKDGVLVDSVIAPEGLRYVVLFTYAHGKAPDYGDEDCQIAYLYGKSVAKIHAASDTFKSPHKRFTLDLGYLLDVPLQTIQPFLLHRLEDWEYLVTLANTLRQQVKDISALSLEFGFCHGDFHGGNAHVDQDMTLTFFDFDCCGVGWRAYDMAVFRWNQRHLKKEKKTWPSFLRGYTEDRHISEQDIKATTYFVAIRHIWLLGLHTSNGRDWGVSWINDKYFDRALKFLREWEAEYPTEKYSGADGIRGSISM